MERLEIEIKNRSITDVRLTNNEVDNDEAEIVKLEEERRQLILQQKEFQDNEQKNWYYCCSYVPECKRVTGCVLCKYFARQQK